MDFQLSHYYVSKTTKKKYMLVQDLRSNFPNISTRVCYAVLIFERYDYETALQRLSPHAGKQSVDDLRILLDELPEDARHSYAIQCSVGGLPMELWHVICSKMSNTDIQNVRLVCKGLATTAAEYLVKIISLDTSFTSAKKLRSIARHGQVSRGVEALKFDSALWQDLGCVHHYIQHYKMSLPRSELPQTLGEDATPRERRSTNRQQTKIHQAAETNWAIRTDIMSIQNLIIYASDEEKLALFGIASEFPKLRTLIFRALNCTEHRKLDTTEEYVGLPYFLDRSLAEPFQTIWQLESLLVTGLQSLTAMHVSMRFFNGGGSRSSDWLEKRFCSLTTVKLHFGPLLSHLYTPPQVDSDTASVVAIVENGLLKGALQSAVDLGELRLGFTCMDFDEAPNLMYVIDGCHKWTKLAKLDLAGFQTTEAQLLSIFACHAALTTVNLLDIVFSKGTWISFLNKFTECKHAKLEWFLTQGRLKDSSETYYTDNCEEEAWASSLCRWSLGLEIQRFLVDPQCFHASTPAELRDQNPLLRPEQFAPPEYLHDTYGPCEDDPFFEADYLDDDDMDIDSDLGLPVTDTITTVDSPASMSTGAVVPDSEGLTPV